MEKQRKKPLFPMVKKLKKCHLLSPIFVAFFMLLFIGAYAESNSGLLVPDALQQDVTITGRITDESGESLPGVSVVVRGTTIGTVTNSDGN